MEEIATVLKDLTAKVGTNQEDFVGCLLKQHQDAASALQKENSASKIAPLKMKYCTESRRIVWVKMERESRVRSLKLRNPLSISLRKITRTLLNTCPDRGFLTGDYSQDAQ